MIRSARSKIILILLLFAHIITPMRLPDVKMMFYDEAEQNVFAPVLNVENYMSLGTLAFQAASFVWLIKKNALFGTELIPRRVNISSYLALLKSKRLISAGTFLGLLCTTIFSVLNRAPQVCIHSDINTSINTLLLTSSMMHISNLIYDDALSTLMKNKNSFIELVLKQELDVSALSGVQCLICLDDARTCGYVNLCKQEDHIFCKECAIGCFNEAKQKTNFANKYFCELCRKDIPHNDEKFEIRVPSEPKVTLGVWLKQMGPMVFFYGLSLYMLMKIMECQFS